MSTPRPKRPLPKPVDIHSALEEVLSRLAGLEGDRALIGGVALSFFGVDRYTKDVDVAVTVAQTERAAVLFEDADPRRLRIGGVSVLTKAAVRVGLIDRRREFRSLFEEAIADAAARGDVATVGSWELPVVRGPYLVALKLLADRPQDLVDVEGLLRVEELDYQETREVVLRHLGLFAARRPDKLARAIGRTDAPQDYENGGSEYEQ